MVVSVVDTGVSRVSNTGDGMESNEGLGAGQLRSYISDVGMNGGKSTEKKRSPFRLGTMEDKLKTRKKVGLGIRVGSQRNETA
jgi:hypothetical protein